MKNLYLDANFLIAILVGGHEFHDKAVELLTIILNSETGYNLIISTLTLDEVWAHTMPYTYPNPEKNPTRYSSFAEEFQNMVLKLLSHQKFMLIPIDSPKQIFEKAIGGSKSYNLKPRDAFHYALASFYQASIVTFDSDFRFSKTDLEVISGDEKGNKLS